MEEPSTFMSSLGSSFGMAQFVLAVLVIMSVASWYLIVLKAWLTTKRTRQSRSFFERFQNVHTIAEAERLSRQHRPADPFARLLATGLSACGQLNSQGNGGAFDLSSPEDYVSEMLSQGIADETRALESGLSFMASVGSVAPFVGLFGTVLGIYHALTAIGQAGQNTLDSVAGPVGETLIMTACGLGVAIPAVLAYNYFVRSNRNLIGEMEAFAHTVFGLLATGWVSRPDNRNESEALRLSIGTATPSGER